MIKNLSLDYNLLSPGINIRKSKLKNYLKIHGKKIVTDLDIFYSAYPKNLKITITGTKTNSGTMVIL